jgi:hypothetical protein
MEGGTAPEEMKKEIPMYTKKIAHRTAVAIITANTESGPFSTRLYVNNGETATLQIKNAKTVMGAERQAAEMLGRHFAGR